MPSGNNCYISEWNKKKNKCLESLPIPKIKECKESGGGTSAQNNPVNSSLYLNGLQYIQIIVLFPIGTNLSAQ